jgi:hypothetical protein
MPLPNGPIQNAFETPHDTEYGVLDLREGRQPGVRRPVKQFFGPCSR